jgi:hypothetical protein
MTLLVCLKDQQPVPSSPTKKIKLAHLPDFSHQKMTLKNPSQQQQQPPLLPPNKRVSTHIILAIFIN